MFVLVYMDGIVFTGFNSSSLQQFVTDFHDHFALKDMGSLKLFLGIQVTRYSQGLHMLQTKYMHDLFQCASLVDSKPRTTPISSLGIKYGVALDNPTHFRILLGALQ